MFALNKTALIKKLQRIFRSLGYNRAQALMAEDQDRDWQWVADHHPKDADLRVGMSYKLAAEADPTYREMHRLGEEATA